MTICNKRRPEETRDKRRQEAIQSDKSGQEDTRAIKRRQEGRIANKRRQVHARRTGKSRQEQTRGDQVQEGRQVRQEKASADKVR